MKKVVIVAAARTPIGSFMGSLAGISATDLGAIAIKGVLEKIDLDPEKVQEVFMGNVLQAGVGQAPARQAALKAGLSNEVPCTTINKVCSSGLKSIILAAQTILCGDNDIVIAGGMENMSQVPHYLSNSRTGIKFGNSQLIDGIVHDGLTDAYDKNVMGVCAELCAKEYAITREQQDAFAIESYTRSKKAWEKGYFEDEIIPVAIPQKRGEPILFSEDEEYKNVNFEKMASLPTVFQKEGTITAGNASTLNDGAAALVLMSEEKAKELGITPLASILSYADAAQEPQWFTTAPAKALPLATKKAKLELSDLDYIELNEAFSVVGLANTQLMKLEAHKVNVNGGAVSLGHPLGCSGARILVTLVHILKQNSARYGGAGICNGGGGASAMVIENYK